jgi:hypothetical protein
MEMAREIEVWGKMERAEAREYFMIYRGPGFLAVV